MKTGKPAAQAVAKKAAALKAEAEERAAPVRQAQLAENAAQLGEATLAADVPRDRHERQRVDSERAPPAVRLLSKSEIRAITGVSFPTVWAWMRAGTFPRSRMVGGKSMWRSDEVESWLAALPVRPLKGDQPNPPEVV